MSTPEHNHRIHYIEFVTTDIAKTKQFYAAAFGWAFEDWGPEYVSFSAASAGIHGGFRLGEVADAEHKDGPLVILYATNLEAAEAAVLAAGGRIVVPTFAFPGGRRFHFSDGAGNLLGVWSQ
jgi:predicted enzyme related to lactoylglutathione lyase